jgi:hypothetical protein
VVLSAQGLFAIDPSSARVRRITDETAAITWPNVSAVAVTPRSLLAYDSKAEEFKEYERASFVVTRRAPASEIGLMPFGGLSWFQGGWLVVGRPYDRGRNARSIGLIKTFFPPEVETTGVALEPAERDVLRGRLEIATVSVSSEGRALLAFQALRTARVIESNGLVRLLKVPVPPGRGLEDNYNGRPLGSPIAYAAAYRDKTVVVGGGWVGKRPAVLTAALGSGPHALALHEFGEEGRPLDGRTLPVGSADPRDYFQGSVVSDLENPGACHVLVLSVRFARESDASKRDIVLWDLDCK